MYEQGKEYQQNNNLFPKDWLDWKFFVNIINKH